MVRRAPIEQQLKCTLLDFAKASKRAVGLLVSPVIDYSQAVRAACLALQSCHGERYGNTIPWETLIDYRYKAFARAAPQHATEIAASREPTS